MHNCVTPILFTLCQLSITLHLSGTDVGGTSAESGHRTQSTAPDYGTASLQEHGKQPSLYEPMRSELLPTAFTSRNYPWRERPMGWPNE